MCLFSKIKRGSQKAKNLSYPMKDVVEILYKLRSARYISKIDLSLPFHQIPLGEQSKQYAAFPVSGLGLAQYKR